MSVGPGFGQHSDLAANLRVVEATRVAQASLAKPGRTLPPRGLRHRRHPRGGRIRPFAVGKHMQEGQVGFGHEIQRFRKQFLGLCREAGDQIGAKGDPRPQVPRPRDDRPRIRRQMTPLHALQDQVAAGLQGQMQMRHQPAFLGDQAPQILVDRCRIQRGQSQPRQLRHQRQQPAHHLPQPWRTG